jgi:RHS repeat-associated protein
VTETCDSTGPNNRTKYSYDGEGRRVQRVASGVTTQYVYDAQGQLAAEFSAQAPTVTGTEYLIADHLGSTRMATNSSGVCLQLHDYLPFGEDAINTLGGRTGCYGTSDGVAEKFTGKERDGETTLDFFDVRYFSGAQGRFTSPDPVSGSPYDSQSWNMYPYARNNPLLYTDPDGQKYRICDTSRNCYDDYSDADFDKNLSQTAYNGNIYQGGEVIGTYQRLSFDDLSPFGNLFFNQMSARRATNNGMIATFAAADAMFAATFASTYAIPAVAAAARAGTALTPAVLNKIHHIFDKPGRNLDALVEKFGSKVAALAALEEATTEQVVGKGLTGQFEEVVNVGGTDVTVRGAVVNGVVKIGTAFRK